MNVACSDRTWTHRQRHRVLLPVSIRWTEDQTVSQPLLKVVNLEKHFPVRGGLFHRVQAHVRAVDGVSFELQPKRTLGLVGESGCGKRFCTLIRIVGTPDDRSNPFGFRVAQ